MRKKARNLLRRLLSQILCLAMVISTMPAMAAKAEEEKFPYTIFASSSQAGAISIKANNLCINGSLATNGTVDSSVELNINGNIIEQVGLPMVSLEGKIFENFFSWGINNYLGSFCSNEMNQNINQSLSSSEQIELMGNVNLNAAMKAEMDIIIDGQTMNANNCVIYAVSGDIIIESDNVSITGLLYAPKGKICIKAQNLNLNNVILLAETVSLECSGANINYNEVMGNFIGSIEKNEPLMPMEPTKIPTGPTVIPLTPTVFPEEPTAQPEQITFSAFGEYDAQANQIEVWWRSNYDGGTYEIYTATDNEEYAKIAEVTDAESYCYSVEEADGTNYVKAVLLTGEGEKIEAVPFQFSVKENGLDIIPLDSDGDGIPDATELKLGTDVYLLDSDGDGFSDYQELYEIGTNPVKKRKILARILTRMV